MNSEASKPERQRPQAARTNVPQIGVQTHRRHRHRQQKGGDDADRRGDLMRNRDEAVERCQREEADQEPGERRPAPLADAGEAEQRAHFAQRDDDRRHHRDAGQLGDGSELPGVAAALERRRDGLGDFVNRRPGPQAVGARRQMQKPCATG